MQLSNLRKHCIGAIEKYANVMKLHGARVLDVGIAGDPPPGGNFKIFGPGNIYETLDIDQQYNPTYVGDICHAPFKRGEFDLVILSNTLEHVWKYRKAISEVARITKKYAIIDSPFMYPYHAEDNFGDWWRFTTPALQRLSEAEGFKVVEGFQYDELSSILCQKQ